MLSHNAPCLEKTLENEITLENQEPAALCLSGMPRLLTALFASVPMFPPQMHLGFCSSVTKVYTRP